MQKWMIALCFFTGTVFTAFSQSVEGIWKTIDDETGEAKSHLQLYVQNGKLYGKVEKTLRKNAATVCEKCPGDRKGKPLVGMVLLENLYLKGGYWQGGQILDPEKGKWYNCKIWLKAGDPNQMQVRGSIGPFYRTQTWYRVVESK